MYFCCDDDDDDDDDGKYIKDDIPRKITKLYTNYTHISAKNFKTIFMLYGLIYLHNKIRY